MTDFIEADVGTRRGETGAEDISRLIGSTKNVLWFNWIDSASKARGQTVYVVHQEDTADYTDASIDSVQNDHRTSWVDSIEAPLKVENLQIMLEALTSDWLTHAFTRATGITSTLVSSRSGTRSERDTADTDTMWTDKKNQRRCHLIDREIEGIISEPEQAELERLQAEMLKYRREVAPLPLGPLREIHQRLMNQVQDLDS